MEKDACRHFRGARFIESAGHWVQQEQPEKVARLLLQFLHENNRGDRPMQAGARTGAG